MGCFKENNCDHYRIKSFCRTGFVGEWASVWLCIGMHNEKLAQVTSHARATSDTQLKREKRKEKQCSPTCHLLTFATNSSLTYRRLLCHKEKGKALLSFSLTLLTPPKPESGAVVA
ncbi:hypothetical protein AMECASPLE_002469 [Ameca splendens]|uniref:Uncharacterized protein n=1 Tax=Ameca splendens TaxID=208324 RepID=A0ABV0ZU99_9TELE